MALPDSYTMKTGAITAYFDAIKGAEPPERFSVRFLHDLGFTSPNDRLFIGILKDLGFLDTDGVPQERYFQYLDKTKSSYVLAEGIRESYSDLFAVNKEAHKLDVEGANNKLRTLYKGAKKNTVIKLIARTFTSLCEIADFSKAPSVLPSKPLEKPKVEPKESKVDKDKNKKTVPPSEERKIATLESLQYHINVILPETRDQAVYDAIFKSLRDHLG